MFVEGCVPFDEFLLVFRYVSERVNRVRSAGGDAGATVDAAIGIDVHLSRGLEGRLVLFGMDAIRGTDVDTEGVFDAGISNYISHDDSVSWNEHFRLAHRGVYFARFAAGGDCRHRQLCASKIGRSVDKRGRGENIDRCVKSRRTVTGVTEIRMGGGLNKHN